MGLKEDILANSSCTALVEARDCTGIAALMSAGRVGDNGREIGSGTIIEILGLTAGNAFLDILLNASSASPFRHVKPLVEQGRLRIGSKMVQEQVMVLVPTVLTLDQANALCLVGQCPNPYTALDIADALFHTDGSLK